MERVKVYKVNRGFSKFLIAFGTTLLIIGIFLAVKFIAGDSKIDWVLFLFILQGVLFIFLGYSRLKSERYFIEWDETQLRYLLPDSRSVEAIRFSEIRNVRIDLFEIHLILEASEMTIKLDNLQFKQIQTLKQMFETIKVESKSIETIHK
jgi:hypothetical protein